MKIFTIENQILGGDLNYKTFILTCKRFPTIHEYILVYAKIKRVSMAG